MVSIGIFGFFFGLYQNLAPLEFLFFDHYFYVYFDRTIMGEIEIAIDGTQWIKLKAGGSRGRTSVRMIFKDIAGPTGYAKRNIVRLSD